MFTISEHPRYDEQFYFFPRVMTDLLIFSLVVVARMSEALSATQTNGAEFA